jgi:peptidoglycan hydrolase-like protein with peptidoglycan-binding domain
MKVRERISKSFWLATATAFAVLVSPFFLAPVSATETYNSAQLKYLFTGVEVEASPGGCTGVIGKGGVITMTLNFAARESLEYVEICNAEGFSVVQHEGKASWKVNDGQICISNSKGFQFSTSFNENSCWKIAKWQFGFAAIDSQGQEAWKMTLNSHPKHSSKEEIWAALETVSNDTEIAEQKAKEEKLRQQEAALLQAEAEEQARAERERQVEEEKRLAAEAEAQRQSHEAKRKAELVSTQRAADDAKRQKEARIAAEERRKREQLLAEAKAIESSLSELELQYVQWGLKNTGFYSGPIDGEFGFGTRGSIKRYQRDKGDSETGYLNEAAVAELLETGRPLYETAEAERQKKEKEKARQVAELEEKNNEQEMAKASSKTGAGEGSLDQQIATLKRLKDNGLITEQQFEDGRQYALNKYLGLSAKASVTSSKKLSPKTKPRRYSDVNFGKYYALVIGNNEYKHLPKLVTAQKDAKAISSVLKKTFGFEVTTLENATRDDILDAFDDYEGRLGKSDNLLVYYAGHGWLDDARGEGYWLPVDAKSNRRSNWVANGTITHTLKALKAKHVMVVADSCYSGTLTRGLKVEKKDVDYVREVVGKRARIAMTSGGLEPVEDGGGSENSPFATALINAMKNSDEVLSGTDLFKRIQRPVKLNADQTPLYSDIRKAGHDGGDFLFVRK